MTEGNDRKCLFPPLSLMDIQCLHIGCFCLVWQQALGLEEHWLAVSTGTASLVYRHLKMFASQAGSWSTVMESAYCSVEHQQPALAGNLHAGVQERGRRRECCGKMQ